MKFKENKGEILITTKRQKELQAIFRDKKSVPENIIKILTTWSKSIIKFC